MSQNVNIKELIDEIGLKKITCPHCGKTQSGTKTVKELFLLILDRCKELHKEKKAIVIPKFGKFYVRTYKGRAVENNPFTDYIKERMVLKFTQTPSAKKRLNKKEKTHG